jgi:hypothetical protein
MQQRNIGQKSALFWIAWASKAEKDGDLNMASNTFEKGIQYGALPEIFLKDRYEQFQKRHCLKISLTTTTQPADQSLSQPILSSFHFSSNPNNHREQGKEEEEEEPKTPSQSNNNISSQQMSSLIQVITNIILVSIIDLF